MNANGKKIIEFGVVWLLKHVREYIDAIKYDLTWPQEWVRTYTDNITILKHQLFQSLQQKQQIQIKLRNTKNL